MAVLALAAAGAWLAPAGYAAIGWTIGSALGSAITNNSKHTSQEGPRLADLSVQTSTDGAPILQLFGASRVAGNIIWSAGIKESRADTTQDLGGKGGGPSVTTTSYTYTCSFAVSLGEGPIIGVRRIWADGKLIYTLLADATAQEIQLSAALAERIEMYLGTETQLPSPTIEAYLGAGNVPGYRGQAYLVFADLPLADFGNRLPNLTFEVIQSGAEVTAPRSVAVVSPSGVAISPSVPVIFSVDQGIVRCGLVNSTLINLFTLYGVYIGTDQRTGDETSFPAQSGSAEYPVGILGGCGVSYVAAGLIQPISSGNVLPIRQITPLFQLRVGDLTDPLPDAEYVGGCALSADGEHAIVMTSAVNAAPGGTTVDKWYLVRWDGSSVSLVDSGAITPAQSIYSFGFGNVTYYHYGCSHLESDLKHLWFGYSASGVITLYQINSAGILAAIYTSPAQPTGSTYPTIYADKAICVLVMGNVVVTYARAPSIAATSATLSSVVSALCAGAGLSGGAIDVTALTGSVDGYVLTQPMSTRAALEPLMRAYFFDAIESGNVIKFVPRGGASDKTIPVADLAAHADGESLPDAISIDRTQEMELPREVVVLYMDPAADYQQGSQSARRIVTQGRDSTTIELPIVLTADRARQVAEVLLTDAWMARRTYPLSLPPKYIDVEPTDVITLVGTNATHVVRVIDQEIGANGVIRCQAVAESAAVYTSTATGAPADVAQQSLTLVGPTQLQMLDIPLLRDGDDGPGCYLAAAGYLGGWKGAIIEQSRDNGESWSAVASKLTAAVIGFTTNVLAAGSPRLWDHTSSVNVRIPAGTLSSSTEDGVLGGANVALIGVHGRWEVLHFRDAALQSDGTWTLTHFLRGCFGTEYAVDKHAVNDVFILVTATSLLHIDQSLTDISLALKYHALSIGAPAYTPAVLDYTNTGRALRPYPVSGLAGIKQSNGDWLFQWEPRARKGQNWINVATVAADTAITGYQVDILNGSTVVRSVLVTGSTSFTYPAGGQQQDFAAVQSTLKVRVYAYNAQVGNGYGVEVTAPASTETYLAQAAFTAVAYSSPGSYFGAARPQITTLTLGGNFAAGTIYSIALGTTAFSYTALVGDTNLTGVAAAIAALIDPNASYAASAASGVVTVSGPVSTPYPVTVSTSSPGLKLTLAQAAAAGRSAIRKRLQYYVEFTSLATALNYQGSANDILFELRVVNGVWDGSYPKVGVYPSEAPVVSTYSYTLTTDPFSNPNDIVNGLINSWRNSGDATSKDVWLAPATGPGKGIANIEVSLPLNVSGWDVWPVTTRVDTGGPSTNLFYMYPPIILHPGQLAETAKPQKVSAVVTGAPVTSTLYRVTLGGTNYDYTATGSDTTSAAIATQLAAVIQAGGTYAASATGDVITITGATNTTYTYTSAVTPPAGTPTIGFSITQTAI